MYIFLHSLTCITVSELKLSVRRQNKISDFIYAILPMCRGGALNFAVQSNN